MRNLRGILRREKHRSLDGRGLRKEERRTSERISKTKDKEEGCYKKEKIRNRFKTFLSRELKKE